MTATSEAIEDYDIHHLTDDLLGLLDDLGEEQAFFVGHDWGSMVVWQQAQLHPDRVLGVVGMSVPYPPRTPAPPVKLMRKLFGDNFFYIIYFQEPGVADAELGADAARAAVANVALHLWRPIQPSLRTRPKLSCLTRRSKMRSTNC